MPYDFVATKRAYRSPDGSYVSRLELRERVEVLLDYLKKEAARIADSYDAGNISVTQFEILMRELLKAGHTIAASTGRGGWRQMNLRDWGKVGAKIRWQYSYLAKFSRKLAAGTLKKANTAYRAKSYVSAVYISYENARREAQTEFIEGGGDVNPKDEMMCYLEQNSQEGCEECTADAAAGEMPVSEMGLLGSRLCGDFCKCEIIFSDEPGYSPT